MANSEILQPTVGRYYLGFRFRALTSVLIFFHYQQAPIVRGSAFEMAS